MANETRMSFNEMVRRLKAVNFGLQGIELRGRENMNTLLGTMQMIDQVIVALENSINDLNAPEVKVEVVPEEAK